MRRMIRETRDLLEECIDKNSGYETVWHPALDAERHLEKAERNLNELIGLCVMDWGEYD